MRIYYKKREIDYERTLAGLEEIGQQVTISTYDKDLANVRVAVMRAAKSINESTKESRAFTVNKSINGAVISRTA